MAKRQKLWPPTVDVVGVVAVAVAGGVAGGVAGVVVPWFEEPSRLKTHPNRKTRSG